MFTDGPATPVRLEVLLDLVKSRPTGLKRDDIYELLQPSPLRNPSKDDPINAVKNTLSAALPQGLDLLEEKEGRQIQLHASYDKKHTARENILRAADEKVLGSTEVEFHLALFYSYCLGLNKEIYQRTDWNGEKWAEQFRADVFNNEPQKNRFNETKYPGIHRWLSYLGMGWYDPNDQFIPDPTERLLRSFPVIFGSEKQLPGDDFMVKLAETCPELDGGKIFLQANKYGNYNLEDKQYSMGLSQALLGLHEDGIVKLNCPVDSHGWNLENANPRRDDSIKADRLTLIEWREG